MSIDKLERPFKDSLYYEENMEKFKAELAKHQQWTDETRALLDGKEYKISEKSPAGEFNEGDYSYVGQSYSYNGSNESYSYYVEIYIHGDKSKKMLARNYVYSVFYGDHVDIRENLWWTDTSNNVPVNDDDTWSYTEEAFEEGFKHAEEDGVARHP